MTEKKYRGINRDFIFAELTALAEISKESGMSPAEFFSNLLEFSFASLGSCCPDPTHILQVVGNSMGYGGELAEKTLMVDRDEDQYGEH